MKKIILSALSACLVLIGQAQERVVLYNANVVNVEDGVINPSQSVTIENGIITNITKSKKNIAKGEIDLTGKYLMPGMIDSHLHWANFATDRPAMDSLCSAYVKQGVTTVRDVGGDARVIKKYQEYLQKGALKGPSVYYSSFWAGEKYFDLLGRDEPVDVAWNLEIHPGDDYRKAVKEAKECGCMGLKLYADISYEQLCEIVKICKEEGVRAWGHLATNEDNALEVVNAGVEVVSHVYYVNTSKISSDELYAEMVKRGTVLDPTLTISVENKMDYVIKDFAKAYKAGIKFVAGTDYIDISDENSYKCFFLNEMNLYVDRCGVSIIDAIKAATVNGAEILGMKNKLGVIKKGAEADMLVLCENPLLSLKALDNIEKIFIDGKI